MSRLMTVLGIVLLSAGAACAIMGAVNQAPLLARGLDMPTAINMIIGGVLAIGLGGVIGAVQGAGTVAGAVEDLAPLPASVELKPDVEKPGETSAKPMRFPSFSRKMEEAGVPAAATVGATAANEVVTPAVKETITALEQAKSDLEAAFSGDEEQRTAGELYVVEDKVIRGRPARILSDGTVEAETDEGWMRFENVEHLDEYLDAVEQA